LSIGLEAEAVRQIVLHRVALGLVLLLAQHDPRPELGLPGQRV
jgi:hypothetical protein